MTGTEVLVRHAMAEADDRHAPDRWELGSDGRGAAAELALHAKLGDVVAIVSSTEPKALATAAAFAARTGREVEPDERLVEVARPWVCDGYRTAARRYLIGDEPDGWEPRHVVAARVAAAIDDARARAGEGEILVISHGLSLSLHLEAMFPLPFDVYGFWCRLAFPDAWRVDRDELTLTRVATREAW
jgi:broad specificity phosphatase PhoE